MVQALNLSELGGTPLPAGLRCPVVLRLAEAEAWAELRRWGDFSELERRTPSTVAFDASSSGEFAYWDNASLLAPAVRSAGLLRQGYRKVRARRRDFFKALTQGSDSALGSVRFGGKVADFSSDAARGLAARARELAPGGPAASAPSLWLSAGGSYSTAHYDSFHNLFIMLGGEKHVLLSPATDAPLFHIYPGTHPLARQARRHFGQAEAPASARVLAASVRGGEALFIPAGWLHHVTARSAAVSLALTVLPQEHHDFNAWMVEGGGSVLPFLAAAGAWDTPRLAAALRAFTPALLESVEFGEAWARREEDPLETFVNVNYGIQTRRELGWPPRLPAYGPCGQPGAADREAARAAAAQVARRFNAFQEELRGLYIMPYLETALSRVAGAERDPAKIMQITVGFVETCLRK